MSNTSKAILGIALAGILGGGGAYIGFSTVENNKLKSDYTELNNQYEIIKKGYDDQQKLIVSKDTTIEDLKRQLEELKSQQPTTLTAGLYETGTNTLVKSWEQLIADGDITITDGALSFVNTGLAGDLICGKVNNLISCSFSGLGLLTNVDVSRLDTSNLTNFNNMFSACDNLNTINLSNFNTSIVTDMSEMFSHTPRLTSLDLSSFNTTNVTNMFGMFSHLLDLNSLDLSNFDTSKVIDMSSMFDLCGSLVSLNLGKFDTSKVTNMSLMFRSCDSLTDITYAGTIEEWQAKNITNATTGIKEDGTVTVHCSDGDYVIGGSIETPTE